MTTTALDGKRILLIITGGVAAYKTPYIVRGLFKAGADVRCVLTHGGKQFVSNLALEAVSGNKVYSDLFSLTDEAEMGHIRLSREADLIIIAPATADFVGKMAAGLADDLASTILLATDKPVFIAPAMNPVMWQHPAVQHNIQTLQQRGVHMIGPDTGDMACHEHGIGRMTEPDDIITVLNDFVANDKPLSGIHAVLTSGPTIEPIDPVRYIANRSSGKQGHAIAASLAIKGAKVTLISGPSQQPAPNNVTVISVETAQDMLNAAERSLPCDIFISAAAVSDWRVDHAPENKIKKDSGKQPPALKLIENPDILASISKRTDNRPKLVVGFAAETENVLDNARSKKQRKGCDWIVANSVAADLNVFGSDENAVQLITETDTQTWARQSKQNIADKLTTAIIDHMALIKKATP